MIQVEITTKCNAKCIYCYKRGNTGEKEHSMGMDEFKRLVDRIPFQGKRWLLQGCGEPLLSEHLGEMSDYVYQKEKDSIIEIITNASYLNESVFYELIAHHINRISLSIDDTEEEYERLRPNLRWDHILKVLECVREYKQSCESPISVGVTAVAMKRNVFRMDKLLRFLSCYNIDFMSINSLINMNGSLDNEMLNNLDPYEVDDFFQRLTQIGKTLGICVMTPMAYTQTNQVQRCSFQENSMYIDVNGNIDPCCMLASHGSWGRNGEVELAHIRRFAQAWSSGVYPPYCEDCIRQRTAFLGK